MRSPDQLISTLRRNPRLEVTPLQSIRVGGVWARRVEVTVRPHRGYPPFCERPCVATWGSRGNTIVVEAPAVVRLAALRVRGQTVVVTEEPRSGVSLTEPIVRSLRFR